MDDGRRSKKPDGSKGRVLENILLTPGDNTIFHGLGRAPVGWDLLKKETRKFLEYRVSPDEGALGVGRIFSKQRTNRTPERTLVLHSNVEAVVSLLVY